MKLWRLAGAVVITGFTVLVILPAVIKAVHALLIPAVVGVVLYLAVRVVNARLDRW
ncbi:MAG TPA: hypothetical protein VID48_11035 [Solirubrobacteraceae bacterium]|jgi:hypothetical protein